MPNHKCKALKLVVFSIVLHTFTFEHTGASSISQQQSASGVKQAQTSSQQVKQQTSFQITAVPSSTSTSIVQQQQAVGEQSHAGQPNPVEVTKYRQQYQEAAKKRSDLVEEDQLPLATINNHSNRSNNQVSQLRPPQYVDVSALVGVSVLILGMLNRLRLVALIADTIEHKYSSVPI